MTTVATKWGARTYRAGGYHNAGSISTNFSRSTIWTGAVYTACGWARPDQSGSGLFQTIFAHINSGVLLKWIGLNTSGQFELRGGGGGAAFALSWSSGAGVLSGAPVFWCVTNDGTTGASSFKGYVRRTEQKVLDTQVWPGTATSGTEFRFTNDVIFSVMHGRMADIRLWDAVLTPREIMRESLRASPERWANLRGWYPLQGADAASRLQDYSGGTNGAPVNLTESGMQTIWAPRNYARVRVHRPVLLRGEIVVIDPPIGNPRPAAPVLSKRTPRTWTPDTLCLRKRIANAIIRLVRERFSMMVLMSEDELRAELRFEIDMDEEDDIECMLEAAKAEIMREARIRKMYVPWMEARDN